MYQTFISPLTSSCPDSSPTHALLVSFSSAVCQIFHLALPQAPISTQSISSKGILVSDRKNPVLLSVQAMSTSFLVMFLVLIYVSVITEGKKKRKKTQDFVLNHLLFLSVQSPHLPDISNLLPQFINCFIGYLTALLHSRL